MIKSKMIMITIILSVVAQFFHLSSTMAAVDPYEFIKKVGCRPVTSVELDLALTVLCGENRPVHWRDYYNESELHITKDQLELSSLVQSTDTRKKEILPYYKYNYAAAVI